MSILDNRLKKRSRKTIKVSKEENKMTDEQQGNGRQYPDTTTLWGCDPPDLGSYIGPEAQKSPYWTGTEAGIPHMG